ncbi:RNA 2',3'-cyclic phosphodiesterase [Candidatus Pacearchaeota archaeon]|nr:RNA 2',3'-cyclic phosphodiesterase [Candidatus Pacearchaeota archaeon]
MFIAIDLPEHLKAEIFKKAENLYGKKLFYGNITEKNNLHLTLRFLGEVSSDKMDEVIRKIQELKLKKFSCSTGKIGFFDDENHIRVIWIELVSDEFNKIDAEISKAFTEFQSDHEKFTPHMTMARVKSVTNRKEFVEELKKIRLRKADFEVSEICLMKSELTRGGPKYKTIEKIALSD